MELKTAAKAQELGDRLLSLINNVNGMVYRGHRDWSLSVIGAEVEPVTGYTAEEFMSGAVSWKSIIHPDDQGWLKESFRNAVKDRLKSLRVEYRIKHKNGGIRWVADRRQMMYDETGSFAYVDGLLLDVTERKETDRKLAESEYRFRTIADTAVNGMVTVDSRGNIDFFNRAAERLFGFTSDEVVGRNVTMLIPERYRDAHKAGLERYLKMGEPRIIGKTVELEALRKDGTEFSDRTLPRHVGATGGPVFFRHHSRHHRAQALGRGTEGIGREIPGHLRRIQGRDPPGGHREQEIHYRQPFHLRHAPILSRRDPAPWRNGYPSRWRTSPGFSTRLKAQARQEFEVAKDLPVKRKDGSVFFADIKSSPVTISGKQYLIGNFRDATDRRKAEEALTRLGMAVDQAAEAIVVTDTEGNIEYVNPAFERITGYSREEAVGRSMRILKSGKHDEKFYKEMWTTLSRGEVWQGRFINRKKDGTLYDEEDTISPVRDASGKIVNFVAGKRDITREVVLRNQVQTAQRMESVGTLAGGIAHDFNNALTGVLGFGELLKTSSCRRPESVGRCRPDPAIRGTGLDAHEATVDLRPPTGHRSRESEHEQSRTGSVEASEEGDRGTYRSQDLPARGSAFRVRRPGSDGAGPHESVPQRPGRHAVGRAAHHPDRCDDRRRGVRQGTPLREGGAVRPAHRFGQRHRHGREDNRADLRALLYHEGAGERDRPGPRRRVRDRQAAQRIHPRVQRLGKGTTFEIRLPAVDAKPDPRAAAKEERVRGGNETILLAEDDEPVRTLAERILKECGYRVLVARNGEEAVAVFQGERRGNTPGDPRCDDAD